MIDHLGISASDFASARRFYDAALAALEIVPIMEITPDQTGGYQGIGYGKSGKPYFWLSSGETRGTGIHIAFAAASRGQVDQFYKAAIGAGGTDNGPPGLRLHYHPDYYGAFVLDPNGINVEAVCHTPE